jgi:hypothetical protein
LCWKICICYSNVNTDCCYILSTPICIWILWKGTYCSFYQSKNEIHVIRKSPTCRLHKSWKYLFYHLVILLTSIFIWVRMQFLIFKLLILRPWIVWLVYKYWHFVFFWSESQWRWSWRLKVENNSKHIAQNLSEINPITRCLVCSHINWVGSNLKWLSQKVE